MAFFPQWQVREKELSAAVAIITVSQPMKGLKTSLHLHSYGSILISWHLLMVATNCSKNRHHHSITLKYFLNKLWMFLLDFLARERSLYGLEQHNISKTKCFSIKGIRRKNIVDIRLSRFSVTEGERSVSFRGNSLKR